VDITRSAVAIDHHLSVIVKVRDRAVTNYNVIDYIHCHVKVVVIVECIDGKSGVLGAIRWKQIW